MDTRSDEDDFNEFVEEVAERTDKCEAVIKELFEFFWDIPDKRPHGFKQALITFLEDYREILSPELQNYDADFLAETIKNTLCDQKKK